MNFPELVAEVTGIVKRPDLEDRIKSAVKAATLKAHHLDFFYRDLIELTVQFETPKIIQNFLPTDVAPRFRKAKYIRYWFPELGDSGQVGKFFTPIQIENSVDQYNFIKQDVFYQAGQLLQIRGCVEISQVLFGCYQHPSITESGYSSWIANDHPWVIIYEAARVIFRQIGLAEQASFQDSLLAEEYRLLQMSYVDDLPLT